MLLPVYTRGLRLFGPSRKKKNFSVLWPLLTSHSKLYSVFSDFFFFFLPDVCETSPGKSDSLPLIHLPHLHAGIRAVLDFALISKLVRPVMPCM